MVKIDREKILPPNIELTERALSQILLILKHDHTLKGPYFRIQIDGKGCDGFTYATGFDSPSPDDFQIDVKYQSKNFTLLIDPFTSFYLKRGSLDFIQNHDSEGFVVTNLDQADFEGKFWNKDQTKLPPTKD